MTSNSHSADQLALEARSLSKMYRIYDHPCQRVKEALHPLRRRYHREFWALRDIDLAVRRGQTVGIIGVNGSGKSTLLQIICGVLRPTLGEVVVNGSVSALLELGSGFNPQFTGRENVYLQGAILGLSRAEVDGRYQAIVDFADIGDFLNQPVKTYSSGMLVRLAFSIAINVSPDILVVDEALSVGDVFFQAKCFNRLEQLRKNRTTILLVSHDMNTVRSLCDRVILLDEGRMLRQGDPTTVIETYFKQRAFRTGSVDLTHTDPDQSPAEAPVAAAVRPSGDLRYGNGKARLVDYVANGRRRPREITVTSGEILEVTLTHEIDAHITNPLIAVMLRTPNGIQLFGNNTTFNRVDLKPFQAGQTVRSTFRQQLFLNNGQYVLTLAIAEWINDSVVYVDRYVDAIAVLVNGGPFPYSGICNLLGTVEVKQCQPVAATRDKPATASSAWSKTSTGNAACC